MANKNSLFHHPSNYYQNKNKANNNKTQLLKPYNITSLKTQVITNLLTLMIELVDIFTKIQTLGISL